MSIADKILLRKRALIETVNDELKNIAQMEHSRHRSFNNFIANSLSAIAAYCFFLKRSQPLTLTLSMTDNWLFSNFISNSRYFSIKGFRCSVCGTLFKEVYDFQIMCLYGSCHSSKGKEA